MDKVMHIVDIDEISEEEYVNWREINVWDGGLIQILIHQGFSLGIRDIDGKMVKLDRKDLISKIKFKGGSFILPVESIFFIPVNVKYHALNAKYIRFNNQRLFISVMGDGPSTLSETLEDNFLACLHTEIDMFSHSFTHWINRYKKDFTQKRLQEFRRCVRVINVNSILTEPVIGLEVTDSDGKYFGSRAGLYVVPEDHLSELFIMFIRMGFTFTNTDKQNKLYFEKEEDFSL